MKLTLALSCLLLGTGIFTRSSEGDVSSTVKPELPRKFYGGPEGTVSIIIDKSDYELHVYDDKGWYATYPVVFGSSSLEDKKMEGDKKTPEGEFKIISKRLHNKWNRFLMLDYPTKESIERFRQRQQRGEIPKSATVGGGIGIHGTWPHEEYQVDRYKNWTDGCIALKNEDVEELYSYVPVGTKVIIRR